MATQTLLASDNPVFASFAFYTMALCLKMFFVQLSIIYRRMTRKVFSTPEDVKMNDPSGKMKVIKNDEVVERHRNAHINDIENILPFVLIGLFYVTTSPAASIAIFLFRVFTVARYLHSIFYLGQVPQPARGIAFFTGIIVMTYMAVMTLLHYITFM